MTDATVVPGLATATATHYPLNPPTPLPSIRSAPAVALPGDRSTSYPCHDRDVAQQSIERDPDTGSFSPLEKISFDLADPGLFHFPAIPHGKLASFPWLFPQQQRASNDSPGPSDQDHPAPARGSETPSASQLSCQECGKVCRDTKALSQHRRCHRKQHVCIDCDMGFSTKRDLDRHRASAHEKKSASACPFCLKAVGTRADNLKRHVVEFCRGRDRKRHLTSSRSPAKSVE